MERSRGVINSKTLDTGKTRWKLPKKPHTTSSNVTRTDVSKCSSKVDEEMSH